MFLKVLTDQIMAVVFNNHVMVQLEKNGSLVRVCQGKNDNRIWKKWLGFWTLSDKQRHTDSEQWYEEKSDPDTFHVPLRSGRSGEVYTVESKRSLVVMLPGIWNVTDIELLAKV